MRLKDSLTVTDCITGEQHVSKIALAGIEAAVGVVTASQDYGMEAPCTLWKYCYQDGKTTNMCVMENRRVSPF
jgi:hypothetical protein